MGRSLIAKTDAMTGVELTIDYPHHEIHDGNMYEVSAYSTLVANDKWLSLATNGAIGVAAHLTFSGAVDGNGLVELLEDATYSTAGTTTSTATAFNMNRTDTDYAVKMIKNSSAISGGTVVVGIVFPGGKAGQSGGVAGGTRPGLEFITDPAKKYLVRVTNKAGANKAASLSINFYIRGDNPRSGPIIT